MKNLRRFSALLLGLAMLAAAACDSCKKDDDADSSKDIPQTSYTCGPGTHKVGNQCVSDR